MMVGSYCGGRRAATALWVFMSALLMRASCVCSWKAPLRTTSASVASRRQIRRCTLSHQSRYPSYSSSRPVPLSSSRLSVNGHVPSLAFRRSTASSSLSSVQATSADSSSEVVQPRQVPKKFVPYPFQYQQELTARVVSLTNLGMGICRVSVPTTSTNGSSSTNTGHTVHQMANDETAPAHEDSSSNITTSSSSTHQDWVIFVPNVIPGELVKLRVYRNYKSYSDADLIAVLESNSDSRVTTPVCELSQTCGGCQYQHMTIEYQRQWKTQHVRDVLERIGEVRNPVVTPTVGTEHVLHYRSKITPHYEAPRKIANDGDDNKDSYRIEKIGFKIKNSRQLVDVPYCHIATEAINEKLTALREETHNKARTGNLRRPKRGATLLLRHANEGVITDPNTYVTTTVANLSFRFLAGNFFQNNPYMVPVMVQHVVAAATAQASIEGTAKKPMTHLIDCYCGSGLFCLSSAASFDVCVGIEVNQKAVEEAQANAELNNIDNCQFVAASAEAIFDGQRQSDQQRDEDDGSSVYVQDFPRDQTVVVVDPPRKGCSEEFLEQLYDFAPQRVVYMSCDPATQARDAKGLLANGYEITSVQPFDLFPQTRHIECLIIFER